MPIYITRVSLTQKGAETLKEALSAPARSENGSRMPADG